MPSSAPADVRFWREVDVRWVANVWLSARVRTDVPCLEMSTLTMDNRAKHNDGLPSNGRLGTTTRRAVGGIIAAFLLLAAPAMAAESPADLISGFRLKHGEVRVVRDATLDRIALEQARAMAAKDAVSVTRCVGPFARRIASVHVGRAAENIAYGHESFEKTLAQWIDSSGHRKNLLLPNASRVGIASAKDATGKRTYWAMVIAGDYEPNTEAQKRQRASCCRKT